MTGQFKQDTNSVDDTAEPDWDESCDDSADDRTALDANDMPELVECAESSDDSGDDLPELDDIDMTEFWGMPLPIASSRAVHITQGNCRAAGEGEEIL